LPDLWASKALRVTMSDADWSRFEAVVRSLAKAEPTQARAYGLAISTFMHSTNLPLAEPGPLDWLDWERRKTLRLLLTGR
jgi:hypothetical protein